MLDKRSRYLRASGSFVASAALGILFVTGCSLLPESSTSPSTTSENTPSAPATQPDVAIVGDFGSGDANEQAVATLVETWNPRMVLTVGDNTYDNASYSDRVGAFYSRWLNTNNFFAAVGNHDVAFGMAKFDSFFQTTPETRYFVQRSGNTDFFVLDSEAALESAANMDAQHIWLEEQTRASTAAFKVVLLHRPPFSSGTTHGSSPEFQWDYAAMGVNLVVAGHDHLYERAERGGVTYVVDGTGGKSLYTCGTPVSGSVICDDRNFGALFLSSTATTLTGRFVSVTGGVVDGFEVTH